MKKDMTQQRMSNCTYINDKDTHILVTAKIEGKAIWHASGGVVSDAICGGHVMLQFIVAPSCEYVVSGDVNRIISWSEEQDIDNCLSRQYELGMRFLRANVI